MKNRKKTRKRRTTEIYRKSLIPLLVIVLTPFLIYFAVDITTSNASSKQSNDLPVLNSEKENVFLNDVEKWAPSTKEKRSYMDDLRYYSALKYYNDEEDKYVRISTLGSSVTAGAGATTVDDNWSSLLLSHIRRQDDLFRVSLMSNGFGGYSTRALIEEKKVQTIVDQAPDLVILETSILNNHGQSLSLKETLNDLNTIVTSLEKSLPDSKIILISPNPKGEAKDTENSIGLTMRDYSGATQEYILEKGWEYVDIFNAFEKQYGNTIDTVLRDGVHPNDNGYKFWANTLIKAFEEEK